METVWAKAANRLFEAWCKMYVKPWHPELAMVEMCVLSQYISASSCGRNWSAHWHISSKLRNRLEQATTEKLIYVYSNSKMVSVTCNANELKMPAWAVHHMKMHSCIVTSSDPVAHCPAGWSQPG